MVALIYVKKLKIKNFLQMKITLKLFMYCNDFCPGTFMRILHLDTVYLYTAGLYICMSIYICSF